jgi:hypothetical protein
VEVSETQTMLFRHLNKSRHVLRQYSLLIKRTLEETKAAYAIAVVPELGYALCEIADAKRASF